MFARLCWALQTFLILLISSVDNYLCILLFNFKKFIKLYLVLIIKYIIGKFEVIMFLYSLNLLMFNFISFFNKWFCEQFED